MPNVTTYIRKDDMELWAACPNKAELIHNALHKLPFGEPRNVDWSKAVELNVSKHDVRAKKIAEPRTPDLNKMDEEFRNHVFSKPEIVENIPRSSRFDGPLCKIHGLPLDNNGKCLQKGCKYS